MEVSPCIPRALGLLPSELPASSFLLGLCWAPERAFPNAPYKVGLRVGTSPSFIFLIPPPETLFSLPLAPHQTGTHYALQS